MPWQVIEYMDQNPQVLPKDVIAHYAKDLEVNKQIDYLKNFVDKFLLLREQLRPLYGKKMDIEQSMTLLNSEFEMQVYAEYPPKVGNEKQRKELKLKLQNGDNRYQTLQKELAEANEEIEKLKEELYVVQENAKNARRILETFNQYVSYILTCTTPGNSVPLNNTGDDSSNHNVF